MTPSVGRSSRLWYVYGLCLLLLLLLLFVCLKGQSFNPSFTPINLNYLLKGNRKPSNFQIPARSNLRLKDGQLPLPASLNLTYESGGKCKRRLPHCIIIGIEKCGTTALLRFLNFHPDIAAAYKSFEGRDEARFFSSFYDEGIDWYRRKMPCSFSNQVTIEKSPPYFFRAFVPERIKKMNSSIQLILTVKDPVERALSEFVMDTHNGKLDKDADFEEEVTKAGKFDLKSNYIYHSLYDVHIAAWVKTFKGRQIHVMDGQKFIDTPAAELYKIEKFLNIRDYFGKDKFVYNKTKKFYCFDQGGSDLYCMGSGKGRSHPKLSPKFLQKFRKFLKPHNERFFNLLGKRFVWGY